MVFEVKLTHRARRDLVETLDFISENSHSASENWNAQFWEIVFSLDQKPERFAPIQEAPDFPQTYRCAHLHSHRIIFRIDEDQKTVYVVRVYHGARRPLESGDLR